MRYGLEHNDERRRQLQRKHHPFTGGDLDVLDYDLIEGLDVVVHGQIDARSPVKLAQIFVQRHRFRIVRGDSANPWAYGESDLHHFVERRAVPRGAKRANIFVLDDRLQRRIGVENPAAAWTQNVPGNLEQADRGCMQEPRDGALLVEAVICGEGKRVQPAQAPIRSLHYKRFYRIGDCGIDGIPQELKKGTGFAHDPPSGWLGRLDRLGLLRFRLGRAEKWRLREPERNMRAGI